MTNDHDSDQNLAGNPTEKDLAPESIDESKVASPAQPSRKRRWMKILGVLGALLLLLLLLTPTILSSSVVRSFVVGTINDNLNGRVDIADWKVSWTSGITITGVRVFDDKNSQIAQVESISTELSLLRAIGGNLKLGETIIRGPDFTLIQDSDGSINFAKLAKPSDKPDKPASDLPKLSGNIRIENGRGTFVRNSGDPKTSQKVKMTDIAATVTIADINQPIEHSLTVTASVNDGPAGTVSVKGKAGVITASRVQIDTASLDESVELKNLDAGATGAFLPPGVVRQLTGVLNGTVQLKVAGGKSAEIRGQLDGKQVAFATEKFAPGEAYMTDVLSITLPLTISLPQGLTDFDSAVVRTDGAISLKTGQVQLSLAVDAPLASLMSAAKNQAVAAPGKLHQTLVVNLPPILAMLPKTLGMREGATLTSGTLEQSVTADLSPGQSQIAVAVDIKQIDGAAPLTSAPGQTTPQRFTVEPVSLKFNTTSRGGGFAAPDLRDLKLDLSSGFASGNFIAPTLASLQGKIDADLAKLKQQLGQFLSLDDMPLAGKVIIAASNSGDPTRPAEPATFSVTVTGTDINTSIAGKAIRQALVRAGVSGTVLRAETGDVKEVRDLRITSIVGNETSPTVDMQIDAPVVTYVPPAAGSAGRYDIPTFTIARANIALKQAQADFGALVPAMKDYDLSAGVASISGGGAMVDGVMRFNGVVATTNMSLGRFLALSETGPGSLVRSRSDVLVGYTLSVNVDATYHPLPDGGAKMTVDKLQVADNRKLLSITRTEALSVTMPQKGSPQAAGTLEIGVDLAQAHDLFRKLRATGKGVIDEATSPDKPILVKQGRLAALIGFTQLANGAMTLGLQGGIDGLSIAGNHPIITNEKVALTIDGLKFDPAGLGALSVAKLGVAFESSGALGVVANGRVIDPGRSRVFDSVAADVAYDGEKLWPIVRGMMADAATPPDKDPYKDYIIRGKANRAWVIGGSFPAVDGKGQALATTVALRNLIARGSVALDLVEAEGLTMQAIDLPVTLVGGVMTLIDDTRPQGGQRPAPIACNSGTIDVGGIAIDLTGEFPTLSSPANQALLSKVQLNPALAKSLGDLVNNPLFVPSAETRGIMDVLIVECRDVPLGKQLKVHGPANKGYALAKFSFSGAQLKNDMIVGVMGLLNADADSLLGSIRDGKVEYRSGFIGHDMTFVLGERQERTLWLYGSVRLADNQMLPLTMFISPQWFSSEIARYAPKGVPLALSGSFRAPQYNFQAAVQETIKQNFFSGKPEDIGNLIDLFSGKKKAPVPAPKPGPGAATKPATPATRPATPPKDNPLGIFGDLLGQAAKDRERKEQEKKDQEKRAKETRDAKKKQN